MLPQTVIANLDKAAAVRRDRDRVLSRHGIDYDRIAELTNGPWRESVERINELGRHGQFVRVAEALSPLQREEVKRISQSLAPYNPSNIQDALEQLQGLYAKVAMPDLALRINEIPALAGFGARIADIVESIESSEVEAPVSRSPRFFDLIAAKSAAAQLGLLVLLLDAIGAFEEFAEATTGEDIPDPVQKAANFCIRLAAFLLVLWSMRDEEDPL